MMSITPMLVQYLVGLCCLRRDPEAVDVIVGDMVHDPSAGKDRDVDITVTVKESGSSESALKAFEVKRERAPLDVSTVEQLCAKLLHVRAERTTPAPLPPARQRSLRCWHIPLTRGNAPRHPSLRCL